MRYQEEYQALRLDLKKLRAEIKADLEEPFCEDYYDTRAGRLDIALSLLRGFRNMRRRDRYSAGHAKALAKEKPLTNADFSSFSLS